jgi:hypothetical protein
MPRLKPPPSQQRPQELDPLDLVEPTEPIEIELPGEEGPTEVELAPQPQPQPAPAPEPRPEPVPAVEANVLAQQLAAQQRAEQLQRDNAAMQTQIAERDAQLLQERSRGDDAEYNSVLTAIAAEQAVLDKAEADYAAYAQAGDFATAAKAQRVLASAAARLDRLEDGKLVFEQRREARKTEPEQKPAPAQAQPTPLDFEQRIAPMPDTAKTWLRKHPEFINDSKLNDKIGAVHQYLTSAKGLEPFSTPYFEALDSEFGFKAAPAAAEPQPQRRSMPVSAPVSRDVPTASGERQPSSKVTLTEEERRIARTSFTASDMTNAQKEYLYAQNKRKLQTMRANGQYPQPERN